MWNFFPGLYRFIYSFHMPVFIFISGYLSKKKDFSHFWESNKKLLVTFLIIHFFICFTGNEITYYGFGYGGNPWITPWFALWYLFALIIWRLSLYVIEPTLNLVSIILVFSIAIIVGFLPINCELSLIRLVSYYPFFFIGVICQKKDFGDLFKSKLNKPQAYIIISLALVFCCLVKIPPYVPLSHYNSLYGVIIRTFWLTASFPIGLSFLRICPVNHFFAMLGRHTLIIYVVHMFVLNFLLYN